MFGFLVWREWSLVVESVGVGEGDDFIFRGLFLFFRLIFSISFRVSGIFSDVVK